MALLSCTRRGVRRASLGPPTSPSPSSRRASWPGRKRGGELEASWTFPGAPSAAPLRLCCLLRLPGLPETHRTAAVKRRGCQCSPHCGFSGCFPSKGQKQSREPALTPKHPQGLRAVSCDSMGGSRFALHWVPVQSCAGERALGGRPPGVREAPASGADPLPPEGVPRALCPGEGALLPAAAPWPTAGPPSAWEFLKLGPARAGRAQELGAGADSGVSACDKCVSRGPNG